MSKTISDYNLSDPISFNNLLTEYNKIQKDIQITFFRNENAVEAYFKGIPFETANYEHPTLDDRVLIDPAVHGNIETNELRLMGTVFQTNSIENQYPGCNTSNYPILDDYIMWTALNPDPVMVQFDIPGDELSDAIPDAVTRHAAKLQQLNFDKDIQIIDDGSSSYVHTINMHNPTGPMLKHFLGTITVMLDIGFPKKVNDIVDAVKTYKSKLYQTIRTLNSATNKNP